MVTYSSINGNGYGGYGEVVFGTDGTLILEQEQDAMLFKGSSTLDADRSQREERQAGDGNVRNRRRHGGRRKQPRAARSAAAIRKRSNIGRGAFAIRLRNISRIAPRSLRWAMRSSL